MQYNSTRSWDGKDRQARNYYAIYGNENQSGRAQTWPNWRMAISHWSWPLMGANPQAPATFFTNQKNTFGFYGFRVFVFSVFVASFPFKSMAKSAFLCECLRLLGSEEKRTRFEGKQRHGHRRNTCWPQSKWLIY